MLSNLIDMLLDQFWYGEVKLGQCMSCGKRFDFDEIGDDDDAVMALVAHTHAGCEGHFRCKLSRVFGLWTKELIVTITEGEMLE